MSLSSDENEAADLLVSDIKAIVGRVYPRNPLQVVGSYSTGLANRLSDIDFNLSFPEYEKNPLERGPSPTRDKARKAAGRALVRMHRAIEKTYHRSKRLFTNAELVHARVPIVKAEHRGTMIRVEIQALATTKDAREYIASYLTEFPTLHTLYIVIRSALHIRDLTNVHKGGLGSYSIFMMIINALKHASGKYSSDDLAGQFLHVLDFYGHADLYKYGYSVDPPRTVLKQGNKMSADDKAARLQDPMLRGIDILKPYSSQKPYLLFLQDPANPVNDLGHKAYGIKHIQHLLGHFSKSLGNRMRDYDAGEMKTRRSVRSHGFLGGFLGAQYESLESQRRMIRTWLGSRKAALADTDDISPTGDHEIKNDRSDDVKEASDANLHVTGSHPAHESSRILPLQEGTQTISLPPASASDARSQNKGINFEETSSGELGIVNSNSVDNESEMSPNPYDTTGISAAGASIVQDATRVTPTVDGAQETLSQNLVNQIIRQQLPSTTDAKMEGTTPQPPVSGSWKRWLPSQQDNVPEDTKELEPESKDQSALESTNIVTHRANLLQRLKRRFEQPAFEKLKDMDWPTLTRLTWHNLFELEVKSSLRNRILTASKTGSFSVHLLSNDRPSKIMWRRCLLLTWPLPTTGKWSQILTPNKSEGSSVA